MNRNFIKIKLVILSLLFTFNYNAQTNTKTLTCLFIGNSYTYVNNLPVLIDSLAKANGDDLVFDQNVIGGYTFNNHFNNATTISKINSQAWQYVVLQAQSQEPSFSPSQVNSQTLPYAIKLDSVINKNNTCSQTVFYETWGRKNGDAGNCGAYPPVCTYTGMQNRLRVSYKMFADTTKSIMSPVGEAFRASISYSPALELYDVDQSHPSLAGSYLAACVFYEVLFKKSVVNNNYKAGLSNAVALHLQNIANKTVNDSLLTWNIGVNEPHAAFTYSFISSNFIQFNSVSTNTTFTHNWYFGQGPNSSAVNPINTYSTAGTHTVSHVVKSLCSGDSAVKTLTLVTVSIKNNNSSTIKISPNPVNDYLVIKTNKNLNGSFSIYDVNNKLISKGVLNETVDVKKLSNGIYFIEIDWTEGKEKIKFIKN
jgi:hypothetical protein